MSYKFVVGVAACDWLTLSVRQEAIPAMYQYCKRGRTDATISQRRHGGGVFTGFCGDGFFWGERLVKSTEWGIFISSGYRAQIHKEEIKGLGLGDGLHCTRYDVQLTLPKPANYDPYLSRQNLELASGSEWGMIGVKSKGMTLTRGNRSSDRYTRVYEKGDSDDDLPFIRWETEYKGERSKAIWTSSPKDASLLLGEIQRGTLEGVSEIADLFRQHLAGYTSFGITLEKAKPAAIKWLETQVSPCVNRLLLSDEPDEATAVRRIIRSWLESIEKIDNAL